MTRRERDPIYFAAIALCTGVATEVVKFYETQIGGYLLGMPERTHFVDTLVVLGLFITGFLGLISVGLAIKVRPRETSWNIGLVILLVGVTGVAVHLLRLKSQAW